MTKSAWRITPEDDVAVVLEDVAQGEQVRCGSLLLTAGAAIPQGHKIACREIPAGEMVRNMAWRLGRLWRRSALAAMSTPTTSWISRSVSARHTGNNT